MGKSVMQILVWRESMADECDMCLKLKSQAVTYSWIWINGFLVCSRPCYVAAKVRAALAMEADRESH